MTTLRRRFRCGLALSGLVALLALQACGGDDGDGVDDHVDTATLLTLEADGGSLSRDGNAPSGAVRHALVLDGVGAVAAVFSDRPVREGALVAIEELVADWDENGWSASPPAALLTVRDQQGGTWIEVFTLSSPRLRQGELRFVADSTDEITEIPATFVDADLFLQPAAAEEAGGGRVFSLPGGGGTLAPRPAAEGEAKTWELAIRDVSPVAAYLWTGTSPQAGPIETATFVGAWSSYGFDAVPPNASLTVRTGDETALAVLTLTDPVYDADASALRFSASDVAGAEALPAGFAESDLFIDSAGTSGARSRAFTKLIGIDYDLEARCSDDNWSTTTPAGCNPQPSFSCGGDGLAFCPTRCQACFDADLATIKGLGVGAIMIYNPNWYALTAAQAAPMKVLLGTFNDTVAGLAAPDAASGCTYSSFPTACGATYARYLIDGACGSTSPWDPNQFCGDSQTFITPFKPFLDDGTVIGIQIGNELLANGFTREQVLAAAQTLRGVLDARGYTGDRVPIVVSLVLGNEAEFCSGGAPPANVDFIAAHPYCANVAGVPPSWPASGAACLEQVKKDYAEISQARCGAASVFIGETGFNTGCPDVYGTQYVADATAFVSGVTQWACEQSLGLFHFAFVDACPQGGCLAGCPSQPRQGNGYFGLYSTEGHLTKGPLVPKLSPMPSLRCP